MRKHKAHYVAPEIVEQSLAQGPASPRGTNISGVIIADSHPYRPKAAREATMPPEPKAPRRSTAERMQNYRLFARTLGAMAVGKLKEAGGNARAFFTAADETNRPPAETARRTPADDFRSILDGYLGASHGRQGKWTARGATPEAVKRTSGLATVNSEVSLSRTVSSIGQVREELRIRRVDQDGRQAHSEYITAITAARGAEPTLVRSSVPYEDVEAARYAATRARLRYGAQSMPDIDAQSAYHRTLIGGGRVEEADLARTSSLLAAANMSPAVYQADPVRQPGVYQAAAV